MLNYEKNEVPTLRPVKPEDPGGKHFLDLAEGGFDLQSLQRIVRSCDDQPMRWRMRADLCNAYYDNKQLNEEQIAACHEEGLVPRSLNLISRMVNVVLGHEAKTRSDPLISADNDEIEDAAEAMQFKLKQAQREAKVDMAVSQAHASQVKGGVGWCEVSRDWDPLNYRYRVREVHRSKMHWDWASSDFMLRDARWIARSEWHDLDELVAAIPEHKTIFKQLANSWDGWVANSLITDVEQGEYQHMQRAFDDFRAFSVVGHEWLDTIRKRVRMYEIWYKVPAHALVLRTSRTNAVLFDQANKLHQVAVQRGIGKLEKVLTRQVRCAIYAGPYRISDHGTKKRHFPYVPFFAFRDDGDKAPYGLIEGMLAPQDEFNERRLRMQWLLKARQVFADNDALDHAYNNFDDLADEINRPDLSLILNAGRKNSQGVQVQNTLSMQKEQYEAMADARQMIQEVPGIFPSMMGKAQSGQSGVAIASLVEQGITTMGELYDNFTVARTMVYEQVLDMLVEDHSDADLRMRVGQGQSRRVVVLNTFDEQGTPVNHVADLPLEVGFSEVPASPSMRQQTMTMIAEVAKSLNNPQAAAVLIPPMLEASPMNRATRMQAAEEFRKTVGLPTGTSKQRQQAEQAQGQAQQQAQQVELAEKAAKTEQASSAADLNRARVAEIKARITAPVDEIEDVLDEAEGQPLPRQQAQQPRQPA